MSLIGRIVTKILGNDGAPGGMASSSSGTPIGRIVSKILGKGDGRGPTLPDRRV